MKKFILLSGLLLTSSCFADVLQNYNDIATALTNGKPIHLVTDFSQCKATNQLAVKIMSVAGFTPNEIGITDNHIATSVTHFTLNDPYFPGKPVYEFARYTITPDNNMNVTLQILDAASYTLLKDKISFDCGVGVATKIYV